ncbi:hypothetical protein [Cryptosporangium sp. NPDC051539]|uniref:hypothetical protein n=1 Tax=Cryptosporangium sp. NPDC051539 TaxID=3363962 RepID=UPI0037AB92B4
MRDIPEVHADEEDERADLFSALVDRFGRVGGVELELPIRATPSRAATVGFGCD